MHEWFVSLTQFARGVVAGGVLARWFGGDKAWRPAGTQGAWSRFHPLQATHCQQPSGTSAPVRRFWGGPGVGASSKKAHRSICTTRLCLWAKSGGDAQTLECGTTTEAGACDSKTLSPCHSQRSSTGVDNRYRASCHTEPPSRDHVTISRKPTNKHSQCSGPTPLLQPTNVMRNCGRHNTASHLSSRTNSSNQQNRGSKKGLQTLYFHCFAAHCAYFAIAFLRLKKEPCNTRKLRTS